MQNVLEKVTQTEETKGLVSRLQTHLTDDAMARLRIVEAYYQESRGRILSELIEKHLPPVPEGVVALR